MIGATGRTALGVLVALSATGAAARAQDVEPLSTDSVTTLVAHTAIRAPSVSLDSAALQGGPTLDGASVALRTRPAKQEPRTISAAAAGNGLTKGQVYMIVGGAAFIVGAVVGHEVGTIVMLGGAGVGIYGLYLYLDHGG